MSTTWRDDQPIYRQLRERILALILNGQLAEGEPLPSVRQVAKDYQINHLTVAKAYQELVEQALVEKRRGLGMFVLPGARKTVTERERRALLEEQLPQLIARAGELGIERQQLIRAIEETN